MYNFIILQVFLLVLRIAEGEDFVRRSGPEVIIRVHVILVIIWSLAFSRKLSETLRVSPVIENRINKVLLMCKICRHDKPHFWLM